MSILKAFLLPSLLTLVPAATAQTTSQTAPKTSQNTPQPATPPSAIQVAAQRSINAWLALVDSGDYAESWKQAGAAFQSAVTQEKWTATIKNVRDPLGKLTARHIRSATYTQALPGAPDGNYQVFILETSFEHKQLGYETVIASLQKDGSWKVVGYYIK